MDWSVDRIRLFRESLANIYPKEDDARQVVTDVHMKTAQVAFSNKSISTWYHILERAKLERGRLHEIYSYALKENPDSEELRLVASATLPKILKGPEIIDWQGPKTGPQLEKITGARSTLVSVAYLELGMLRSRSVVRVRHVDGSAGTGFVVAKNCD